MRYPTLDEETQCEIEKLEKEELNGLCPLWSYGVDAVVHVVVMKSALRLKSKKQLTDFLHKYEVILGGINYGHESFDLMDDRTKRCVKEGKGIVVSRKTIEKDGVYVLPYYRNDLLLFDRDLQNAFELSEESPVVRQMMSFEQVYWIPDLLLCKPLMKKGLQCGKYLWDASVKMYRRNLELESQPENITTLGEKIIEYHASIVHAQ